MHALACSEEKGGRVREQAECCGKNWFCDIKKSSIKIFYKCCITSIKTVLFFFVELEKLMWVYPEGLLWQHMQEDCEKGARAGGELWDQRHAHQLPGDGRRGRGGGGALAWMGWPGLLWYRKNISLKWLHTVTSYICCLFLSSSTDLVLMTV